MANLLEMVGSIFTGERARPENEPTSTLDMLGALVAQHAMETTSPEDLEELERFSARINRSLAQKAKEFERREFSSSNDNLFYDTKGGGQGRGHAEEASASARAVTCPRRWTTAMMC